MTRIEKRSGTARGSRLAMAGSLAFHSLLLLALWRVAALAAAEDEGPGRFASEVVAPTALPPAPPPPEDLRPPAPDEPPSECLLEEAPVDDTPLFTEVVLSPAPPPAILAIPTERYAAARLRPPVVEPEPVRAAQASPIRKASYEIPRGPTRPARQAKGNARPRYPSRAVAQGLQGRVLLLAALDATGAVTDLEVLESSGYAILDREALRAVSTWSFLPRLVDGTAVASTLEVPVSFELK